MNCLRLRPGLKAGDPAPDFDLQDQDGHRHSLAGYRGRWLVAFFYPKDNTPGCIREACRFGDEYDHFRELGAEVVGVSGDDLASHVRFREGCRLRYQLLSDPGRVLREAWQVPHYFRHFDGRTTYILDPQGVVRFVFDQRSKAEQHPERALEFLRAHARSNQNLENAS